MASASRLYMRNSAGESLGSGSSGSAAICAVGGAGPTTGWESDEECSPEVAMVDVDVGAFDVGVNQLRAERDMRPVPTSPRIASNE
jgi:hypothetical protein